MPNAHPRLQREAHTIELMLELYCQKNHNSRLNLCSECSELKNYALSRLERCPFGEKKPTCANCTVHCYKPAQRQHIRQVMRFSGPRMLLRHPILTVLHLWVDSRRKAPVIARKMMK